MGRVSSYETKGFDHGINSEVGARRIRDGGDEPLASDYSSPRRRGRACVRVQERISFLPLGGDLAELLVHSAGAMDLFYDGPTLGLAAARRRVHTSIGQFSVTTTTAPPLEEVSVAISVPAPPPHHHHRSLKLSHSLAMELQRRSRRPFRMLM